MAGMLTNLYQRDSSDGEQGSYLGIPDFSSAARKYRQQESENSDQNAWTGGSGPLVMPGEVISKDGESAIGDAPAHGAEVLNRYAGDALGLRGEAIATKLQAKAIEKGAEYAAAARKGAANQGLLGKVLGTGFQVASAALFPCDERIKEGIAPLRRCEVDDRLARLALAVQALREHA